MNAMQMRLIVTLDDELVAKASKLTSITDHSALVQAALEALIQDQTERQLGEPTTSEAMSQRTHLIVKKQ
jgi:toxin-antitoxin system, antitoxin component, ribbon-helix-helix domain protein